MNKVHLTLRQLQDAAERCVRYVMANVSITATGRTDWRTQNVKLYGVPRGGIAAAALVMAAFRNENVFATMTDDPYEADIFVDDLRDSGATGDRYVTKYAKPFIVLAHKGDVTEPGQLDYGPLTYPASTWLVFPWEVEEQGNDKSAHDTVTRLLQYIGEDPTREGLKDTPARVIKAWKEWASGYGQDPKDILKVFEGETSDQMVIVHNIPVVSYCEHHMAPIHGTAHVGYLPNATVGIVGLSKLPRLVDVYARRLQVQERMTWQIAQAMETHLKPHGVGVLIRASHMCMSSRGVKIHGSLTTTSAMLGSLRNDAAARSEFITLCRDAERAAGV